MSAPSYHPFPKYLQIRDILSRWLGSISVGDKLPTEEVLSEKFGVSRVTIRKALKDLEDEGLIARRAGVGTWLARTVSEPPDPRLTGPIEDFSGLGAASETVLVSRENVAPSSEVTHVLQLQPGRQVHRIERIRKLGEEPFLLLTAYFPSAVGRKVGRYAHGTGLLVPVLRQVWDPAVIETYQKIEAVTANERLARLLSISVGDPILCVHRVFSDSSGRPVVYFITNFRGDRYYYTVKLQQSQRRPSSASGDSVRTARGNRGNKARPPADDGSSREMRNTVRPAVPPA